MLRQGHGLVKRKRERPSTVQRFLKLGLTVCRLERVGDEVRLMRMMEGRNGELELVREAHHIVEVDGFVAVVVDLHMHVFHSISIPFW